LETNAGVVALSQEKVIAEVERAFANDAQQWREWETNISCISRPDASLQIARFLMSL
jgi:hypothetical protein